MGCLGSALAQRHCHCLQHYTHCSVGQTRLTAHRSPQVAKLSYKCFSCRGRGSADPQPGPVKCSVKLHTEVLTRVACRNALSSQSHRHITGDIQSWSAHVSANDV